MYQNEGKMANILIHVLNIKYFYKVGQKKKFNIILYWDAF
jgi:hypothetical protein